MPVPYQRHGRRHAANGEDPIPISAGPISALGLAYNRSQNTGGQLKFDFDDIYINDSSFSYEQVTSGRARYITITSEGFYQYDAYVSWDTDFTVGDFPYIEPSCYVSGAADLLVNTAAVYWSDTGGVIYGEQFIAAEQDHHLIRSTVYFNFTASDFGDSAPGIGVNLRDSGSRTKTFGAGVQLTRLGDTLTALTTPFT